MLCQLKQRDDQMAIAIIIFHINNGHNGMAILALEEVARLSSYPLLESMVFILMFLMES